MKRKIVAIVFIVTLSTLVAVNGYGSHTEDEFDDDTIKSIMDKIPYPVEEEDIYDMEPNYGKSKHRSKRSVSTVQIVKRYPNHRYDDEPTIIPRISRSPKEPTYDVHEASDDGVPVYWKEPAVIPASDISRHKIDPKKLNEEIGMQSEANLEDVPADEDYVFDYTQTPAKKTKKQDVKIPDATFDYNDDAPISKPKLNKKQKNKNQKTRDAPAHESAYYGDDPEVKSQGQKHQEPPMKFIEQPAKPLVNVMDQSEATVDQNVEASHQHNAEHHEHGGGHHDGAEHHAGHNADSDSGYEKKTFSDKGEKDSEGKHIHKKHYEESQGKKKKHHDNAGHSGHHEEEAHGHKGAKFNEKKGHKKGHKTKGYHNKYHKDEYHKEHKFYDDYHKGGSHHRYGKFHAKHASNENGRKKAQHVDAGHDSDHRAKKGYTHKGHTDSDHKGHSKKHGHEAHHAQNSAHGKKGGQNGGSHYGFKKQK